MVVALIFLLMDTINHIKLYNKKGHCLKCINYIFCMEINCLYQHNYKKKQKKLTKNK